MIVPIRYDSSLDPLIEQGLSAPGCRLYRSFSVYSYMFSAQTWCVDRQYVISEKEYASLAFSSIGQGQHIYWSIVLCSV